MSVQVLGDRAAAPRSGPPQWLIVGGTGQVGAALLERLGAAATWSGRQPCAPFQLDLDDAARSSWLAADVIGAAGAPVVVIAAAMCNVEACQDDEASAHLRNVLAPAALAMAARQQGARTVYFSTEYVFDGVDGPFDEHRRPRPLSAYGRSKYEGEQAVLAADHSALVIRTTVVYGPEAVGRNFAYQVAQRLGSGQTVRAPRDQVSTPTYNRDIAGAVEHLVRRGASGVFHVVGPERMARSEMALRLAHLCSLESSLVQAVATSELAQKASRPLDAGLVSGRLEMADFPMRGLDDAVGHWRLSPRGLAWP